jgi:hypothetical protein
LSQCLGQKFPLARTVCCQACARKIDSESFSTSQPKSTNSTSRLSSSSGWFYCEVSRPRLRPGLRALVTVHPATQYFRAWQHTVRGRDIMRRNILLTNGCGSGFHKIYEEVSILCRFRHTRTYYWSWQKIRPRLHHQPQY